MSKRLDDISARVEAAPKTPDATCNEISCQGQAHVDDDVCDFYQSSRTDIPYLLAIARAAERCALAWDALGETAGDHAERQSEAWDAEQALRAALESKEGVR